MGNIIGPNHAHYRGGPPPRKAVGDDCRRNTERHVSSRDAALASYCFPLAHTAQKKKKKTNTHIHTNTNIQRTLSTKQIDKFT